MWQDLKLGLRMLRTRPGFTAVAGLTMAIGIGACVAIFSVVDGVLLRPLPYPASDRLVVLEETNLPRFTGGFVRPEVFDDWQRQATSFDGLAAVRTRSTTSPAGATRSGWRRRGSPPTRCRCCACSR